MRILPPILLMFLFTLHSNAAPPLQATTPADFYEFQFGDFLVTALLDGFKPRKPAAIATDPNEVKKHLERHRIDEAVMASYNVFLINTGSKLLLVDAGTGDMLGENGGYLVDSLRAAGHQPEQIDAVLITHFHPDHINGLVSDGELVFPNADVFCDERESEYWLDEDQEAKAPEAARERFNQIQSILAPVVESERLKPFPSSSDLFPGVSASTAPGHSPGHTAYLVESGGQTLLFWGDTVHIEQAQFANPELTVKFDWDQGAAAKRRLYFLILADRHGWVIASPHISFPGLGKVIEEETGYRWIPVPYGTDF
jgi:glyoxylase-like metal-dependent hydrolase (beta-lactamase superfamily II)